MEITEAGVFNAFIPCDCMNFFFPEALLVLPSKASHLLKSRIFLGLLDLKLLFLPEESLYYCTITVLF